MTRKTQKEPMLPRDPFWYKDAVIYELHVRAFFDSNGDGVGDFAGLSEKLDYLRDLGVNTLWVLPFYPSPMRDDGYDISDYKNINPQYGTRKEFLGFVRAAHDRGLRVITELVINHTSDQHPWFQAARRAPASSSKRDFYVWSDTPKKFEETRIIFTDSEKSNWAWDEVAHAYYWHRFFSHQPDLNHNNPKVVKAVVRVMQFWLDMGVDGLRLDAIPYLCVREGTINENLPETHAVTRYMRSVIDARYEDRMLLAEANQWPEDVRDYFSDGDECHMAYHFPLMPRMYMAIAQEDRHPVVEIMKQTPDIPENCQWAIFLRNHDELTLEMVTNKERDYMYQMYASDHKARLNLGIRRRLAPLMDNDFDKIRLMNSLLFSMPGSPIIYYGDEIGMGDNIYLGDRNGVRTPMQWSPDRNAGFSKADPQRLFLPPIMDAIYGYESVNVEAQLRDPSSLLNWTRRMLTIRKSSQAFGRGTLIFLEPGNRKVLAYLRIYAGDIILCVANLARSAQPVELELKSYKGRIPVELMGRTPFPPIGDLPYLLTLHGHGFYWFRLTKGEEVPSWHEDRLAPSELPLLVLFDGWRSFFRERVVPWRMAMADKTRYEFEQESLPRFIAGQRWYANKACRIFSAHFLDYAEWGDGEAQWFLALIRTKEGPETESCYFVPMALVWEKDNDARMRDVLALAITRVRQQGAIGVLVDAFADDLFCRGVVDAIAHSVRLVCQGGEIRFRPTARFHESVAHEALCLPIKLSGAHSTNTTVAFGDRLFLKAYRRLQKGTNPEWEMGQFLTEVLCFKHIVPILGVLEYVEEDGSTMTLGLLQEYVDNQGDMWAFTLNYLEKDLESALTSSVAPIPDADPYEIYNALIRVLAQRTGELHCALATRTGNEAFDPEPMTSVDLVRWVKTIQSDIDRSFSLLGMQMASLPPHTQAMARSICEQQERFLNAAQMIFIEPIMGMKIRFHGDFHLGQVLLCQNDFVIIDFEGEPSRSLAARKEKNTPLRDIASMLRSFNYVGYTALSRVTAAQPSTYDVLALRMRGWEKSATQTFLESYKRTVGIERGLYDPDTFESILRLLTLEKGLYELRYEIENRPHWVHVPLLGLMQWLEEV